MIFAVIEPSFSEGSALLGIISVLGSAHLWFLRQHFVSKSVHESARLSDIEQRRKENAEMIKEIEVSKNLAIASNQRHDLAKAPFDGLTEMLKDVKASIEQSNARAEARDVAFHAREDKFLIALSGIDKRVAVIEATQVVKRKR